MRPKCDHSRGNLAYGDNTRPRCNGATHALSRPDGRARLETVQLELTRAELEWLLFNLGAQEVTLPKGRAALDFIVDETGAELYEKLVARAESEGIDF